MAASLAWARVFAVLTARGVLAAMLGMTFWAVAPTALGWHSTTVMTGSMMPSVVDGDVIVSKPVAPSELRIGQVLLFRDPDHVGKLRLHRLVDVDRDGTLVTKGDANPGSDSSRIPRSAVLGVGYLRVPYAGTPVLWLAEHNLAAAGLLGVAVLAVTGVAVVPAVRSTRRGAGGAGSEGAGSGNVGNGGSAHEGGANQANVAADASPVNRHEASPAAGLVAPPPGAPNASRSGPPDVLPATAPDAPPAAERRPGHAVTAAALAVCVAVTLALPAAPAAAAFAAVTAAPANSLAMAEPIPATDLSCTGNRDGSVTVGWQYGGAPVARFALLIDGRRAGEVAPDGRTVNIHPRDLFVWRTSTVTIRADLTDTWTVPSAGGTKITTVRIFGIGRTTCG